MRKNIQQVVSEVGRLVTSGNVVMKCTQINTYTHRSYINIDPEGDLSNQKLPLQKGTCQVVYNLEVNKSEE